MNKQPLPKLSGPRIYRATVLVGGDNQAPSQPRLMSVLAYAKDHAEAEQLADQAVGGIARGILIEEGPDKMPENVERRVLHGVAFFVEPRVQR